MARMPHAHLNQALALAARLLLMTQALYCRSVRRCHVTCTSAVVLSWAGVPVLLYCLLYHLYCLLPLFVRLLMLLQLRHAGLCLGPGMWLLPALQRCYECGNHALTGAAHLPRQLVRVMMWMKIAVRTRSIPLHLH
jgi:hypothetical protein